MRNALMALSQSKLPIGLTQSRYPSNKVQVIPPFSLVWITMIHDYWLRCNDDELIISMIPGTLDVLNWFESRIDSSGMIARPEWWNFVDWAEDEGWHHGAPPGIQDSYSSILNLQYVYTIHKALPLFDAYGYHDRARHFRTLADNIIRKVRKTCLNGHNGLIADTPDQKTFSQHANIFGILTGLFNDVESPAIFSKIISDESLTKTTYYFSFYLFEAMERAGSSDNFVDQLTPWRKMISDGLTTFAEKPDPTRSDCHAWSASPVHYFLSMIAGIKPLEHGFQQILIEPHLGKLKNIEALFPHRKGIVSLSLEENPKGGLSGTIELPPGLKGLYKWKGVSIPLKSGVNVIK